MFIKSLFPNIHITIEKWKYNRNYKIYVSNLGNFKDRLGNFIQVKVDKGGYLMIPLCNNKRGIEKYVYAHRIVMETWRPNPEMWKEKLTVDHKDHNKRNNAVTNLEWVSREENFARANDDLIYDDKDAIIQCLKDKYKLLEAEIAALQGKCKIVANGQISMETWEEVRSFLAKKNPNYQNAHIDNVRKQVTKASKNNTMYNGYTWKVKF